MTKATRPSRSYPPAGARPHPESHQFHDWAGLELARAVAARLRADPSRVEVARENLRRWLARDIYAAGERRALLEWADLIESRPLEELLRVLTEPSEEGDRRRQSWPFVGVLTQDEGRAIYDACEEAGAAHLVG